MGTVFVVSWGAVCSALLCLVWAWPAFRLLLLLLPALHLADFFLKLRDIYWVSRPLIRDVAKRAVLITGCDTGFGNQLAQRLSRKGFKVYACCLSAASPGAKQLSGGSGTTVLTMDVTKQEDIDSAVAVVTQDLKENDLKLWSIVNNAGIGILTETEFMTMSDLQFIFDVNTFGPVRVTKAFLPLLRGAGEGRVVNVASQAGRFTSPGFTPYSMSKHACVSFSDGLRLEMKKWNISVHTIEPGFYKTPIADAERAKARILSMWDKVSEEVRAAYGKDYHNAFAKAMSSACEKASPAVYEVIDDMEHAVAGVKPKIRYIPGTYTKAMTRVLRCLPLTVASSVAERVLAGTCNVKPVAA